MQIKEKIRRDAVKIAAFIAIGLSAAAIATAAWAETPIERGTYLMRAIAACGNCHTPKGPDGDIPGMELAGQAPMEKTPDFEANAPNITPDRETGIGTWSDEEIITAIREGRRPDGSIIGPPMPIAVYRGLSDTDVKAIVAYLRQVTPIRNAVPKSVYNVVLPPNYGPPVGSVPDVPRSDKVAYGAYLAGPVGHCVECHSPMGPNGPDRVNNLGAGGLEFRGAWGVSVSANITPTWLSYYSDADVKRMITHGIRRDGSRMLPPMPYTYFVNLNDDDLDAIVAYLRVLPAK